jgi:DNA gyrase subunit A
LVSDNVDLVEEASKSYMEYALSTIVSRALPDIRDGLKPVQRRIIYAMMEDGLFPDASHVKCVSIVGDTLKKYHPHGDQTVYNTLVNMEQDFNFRYPLVDGQGNFGSINDSQNPAAPRYTEAKMTEYCKYCVSNIDENVVDFVENFDGRYQEPEVLPVPFPNILCNGSTGIAVGMSTNIPPHNLNEVIDATIELIKNPNLEIEDLMKYIQGPDFPSGAYILGTESINELYTEGKSTIVMQAKIMIEERTNGAKNIIITELPYRVSPDKIEIAITDLTKKEEDPISGISDIKNLSDNTRGIYLVIELKKDVNPDAVLSRLFNSTDLRSRFYADMKMIDNNEPTPANLKYILQAFIDFRVLVVTKMLQNRLSKNENEIHLQEGLSLVLDNINRAIDLIQDSKNRKSATKALRNEFGISNKQADYVLDISLSRLTQIGKKVVQDKVKELQKEIDKYKNILSDRDKINNFIIDNLTEIKNILGDKRKTKIIAEKPENINVKDLIGKEKMVITTTRDGYIKRTALNEYKLQQKGGKGVISLTKKEEDAIQELCIAQANQQMLFFTNKGKMYHQDIHRIPQVTRKARGIHVNNLLTIDKSEIVKAGLVLDDNKNDYLISVTKKGRVKKTHLSEYSLEKKRKGILAFKLSDDDEICKILQAVDRNDICILTNDGMIVRYPIEKIKSSGRRAIGAQGIDLSKDAFVVDVQSVTPASRKYIVVVTSCGYGKKSALSEYNANVNRGGKGVKALDLEKDDEVAGMTIVTNQDQIVLISSECKLLRHNSDNLKITGRVTKGVKFIDLDEDEKVVDVVKTIDEKDTFS